MTFDDGILSVFRPENTAGPGDKPQSGYITMGRYYYSFANIGVTRYYTAMQAGQQVSAVVCVPGWNDIQVNDIVEREEAPGHPYIVQMVQPETDEMGLRIDRLTLEVTTLDYKLPTEA